MPENNVNDLELNLDDLEGVSGGTGDSQDHLICPVHTKNPKRIVIQFDNVRYQGGNLTRYKCLLCNRLYSLNQVEGTEDLTIDYTNIRFNDFA